MTAEFKNENAEKITSELARKAVMLKLRKNRDVSIGFGLIAALGGVIIIPILLGIWGGTFLDAHYPVNFSWRLSLIFCGFIWGMVNAYFWIKAENEKIIDDDKKLQEKIDKEMKNDNA